MFEEKKFHEVCKEMRSVVTLDEVREFISLLREQEYECDNRAQNLEDAMESDYLSPSTKYQMQEAANKERQLARKWNALWAVFDHAEFHSLKN